jgi:hypothetical protein
MIKLIKDRPTSKNQKWRLIGAAATAVFFFLSGSIFFKNPLVVNIVAALIVGCLSYFFSTKNWD